MSLKNSILHTTYLNILFRAGRLAMGGYKTIKMKWKCKATYFHTTPSKGYLEKIIYIVGVPEKISILKTLCYIFLLHMWWTWHAAMMETPSDCCFCTHSGYWALQGETPFILLNLSLLPTRNQYQIFCNPIYFVGAYLNFFRHKSQRIDYMNSQKVVFWSKEEKFWNITLHWHCFFSSVLMTIY